MWAALPLCLLSALLATGSALLCEVCLAKGKPCSGPLQLCAPSERTCVKGIATFNQGADSFTYTAKSCLEPANCKTSNFTVTFGQKITRWVNIACCDTDGCNSGSIPVPAVSLVPNGRRCPSCYAAGEDRCKSMKPLPCTGAEDHCVEVTRTLTIGNITLRAAEAGCGSMGSRIMTVGVKKYAQDVVSITKRAKWYPAPRA